MLCVILDYWPTLPWSFVVIHDSVIFPWCFLINCIISFSPYGSSFSFVSALPKAHSLFLIFYISSLWIPITCFNYPKVTPTWRTNSTQRNSTQHRRAIFLILGNPSSARMPPEMKVLPLFIWHLFSFLESSFV